MSWKSDRARLGALSRTRLVGDPELEELRERVTAERKRIQALSHFDRVLDCVASELHGLPALTEAQLAQLVETAKQATGSPAS